MRNSCKCLEIQVNVAMVIEVTLFKRYQFIAYIILYMYMPLCCMLSVHGRKRDTSLAGLFFVAKHIYF